MKDVTTFQKLGVLSVLSLIGSIYIILLKYSRVVDNLKYISSTVVAFQEIAKLLLTVIILLLKNGSISALAREVNQGIIKEKRDTLLMVTPSCLYALQNNMVFLALSNLNVPTQQVLYQLKIPFTAFLCVMWLGKSLTFQKWAAVVMIFFGTSVIEYQSAHNHVTSHGSLQSNNQEENFVLGLAAIIVASLCSAVAGVYFEKMLKKKDASSIWIKNLQMYLWSVPFTLLAVIVEDWYKVKEKGFFFDYTMVVFAIILTSSVGGLLISLVLLYTDNVTKTFSTSVSLLISTFVSCYIFGTELSLYFHFGLGLVSVAILIYAIPCSEKRTNF